ncbi:MAG: DUF58 domain-containing protein [Desulfobacteraceae bacterium]|nr:DUF58 domain-containing protein [Desulfobacteraceae bacterium]
MIAPRNRLLRLAAATLLPAALAAAAFPAVEPLAWTLLAALLLLASLDARNAGLRFRGLRVDLPERIDLVRNREDSFPIHVRETSGRIEPVRLWLDLPPGVESPWNEYSGLTPGGVDRLRVPWPLVGTARGEHVLSRFRTGVVSPLGLWDYYGYHPARTRIRVYPDLFTESGKGAAMLLRKGPGAHVLPRTGQGREFEKLRDYLPGDSMSDIHWKVTAKRGRLATREFQVERTREVYVAVDTSRLSTRTFDAEREAGGVRKGPLIERYISAALSLGATVQGHGDKFGLLAFHRRVLRFVRADSGMAHFRFCLDALFDLQAENVTPDFEELAGFILQNLRRRVLILFLTNLDDPALAESFVQCMRTVGRRHLLLVHTAKPSFIRPVFSNPRVASPDDVYLELGGHLLHQELRDLQIRLGRHAIGFFPSERENLYAEMVAQYLSVKRRQIL